MQSPYDNYDYPSYWLGRDYEHCSEKQAIKYLLSKIPKIKVILEVGSGYGRLTNMYTDKADEIILADPSNRLLALSKKAFKKTKSIKHIKAKLSDLPTLIKGKKIDLIIMVRVLHHIRDCEFAFDNLDKLLSKNAYLIVEFPNKRHVKNTLLNILRGNFSYFYEMKPIDLQDHLDSNEGFPFKNYHPKMVENMLNKRGYSVIERYSASNMRHSLAKTIFSTTILLSVDKMFNRLFTYTYFGPSFFILAKKK